MAKKKKPLQEQGPEAEMDSPFVGGEDDDLMDMEYIQDETTSSVDTHPPATVEEAEQIEAGEDPNEVEDPTPVEEPDDGKDEQPKAEEEAEEAEPEAEPEVLEDTPKVPKDRFDEVNERMKKAEKDAKLFKEQLESIVEQKNEPEPEPYDYATKEKEAMDAVLEGDTDKYAAIRAEIRTAEREETLREAKQLAAQGDQQLQENMTFEEAGARIEQEFPEYVEGSDIFNSEARDEMLDLYVGYAQSGTYTRVEALQRAADRAAKIFGLKGTATTDEAVPDNVVAMKKTNPKAKAKIANAQPPILETRAEGESEEPRRNVKTMSDEEFEALPDSAKRRLRGDVL